MKAVPLTPLSLLGWKMNKHKKRLWITRLARLPQSAAERISQLTSFIPSEVRLYLASILLILATTLLVSQFRLSSMPQYREGDVVLEDIVVPLDVELVRSDPSIQETAAGDNSAICSSKRL